MLKKTFVILVFLSTIFISFSILKIDEEKETTNTYTIQKQKIYRKKEIEEQPIGKIIIPKIQIDKPLYDINSKNNNIEENITILKESIDPINTNSILFIAAHSGTGPIAFFEQLDQLEISDIVKIEYHQKQYTYQINKIYEQEKNGYISGLKEQKRQLVLTTCCPKKNNCQLIINGIEIES